MIKKSVKLLASLGICMLLSIKFGTIYLSLHTIMYVKTGPNSNKFFKKI